MLRRPTPSLGAVLLLGLLATGCAGWGPADGFGPEGPSQLPLEAFVTTRVDSTGADTPEVHVSIPYRSLIFQREGDAYASTIQVTVVARADDRRVGGGVAQAVARVDSFEDTRSRRQLTCRVPLRLRGSGPVDLRTTVAVLETSRNWQRRFTYRPQAVKATPLYFSSYHWNLESDDQAGQILGIGLDTLRVDVGLRRRPGAASWPSGGLQIVASIQEEAQDKALVQRIPLEEGQLQGDSLHVHMAWSSREIYFGRCTLGLRLEVALAAGSEQLSLDPPRSFTNLQVPFWNDQEWKRHVAWLEGIVDRGVRRELADLPVPQRESAWREAFAEAARAAGLPPAVLEARHLLRIVEADARFGGFGRGALSDRGRIYIRYGPPDRIQHFGDEMSREGRWEVWYYLEIGQQFTFYDPQGMGDYQLYETRPI
jgi:GWxTD domain-containing protein